MKNVLLLITVIAAGVYADQPGAGFRIDGPVEPGSLVKLSSQRTGTDSGISVTGRTLAVNSLVSSTTATIGGAYAGQRSGVYSYYQTDGSLGQVFTNANSYYLWHETQPDQWFISSVYLNNLAADTIALYEGAAYTTTGAVVDVTMTGTPSYSSTPASITIDGVPVATEDTVLSVVTNPVVQTLSGDETNAAPSVAAVNDALAEKASIVNGDTDNTFGIAGAGQSNFEGFPGGTNRMPSVFLTGITNAFISYIGQYTATDTNAINYQTNLVYYDYTYNTKISWGVELPVGYALSQMGITQYWYKTGIGGAAPNTFTNGGTWWKYVTNTYQTARATWSNAPVPKAFIFMRGETGSNYQTQEQSYQERLKTWQDLQAYYGNTNLYFIQTGLPGVYYANTNGALVEAGAKQLAAEFPDRVFFVETKDIYAGHYDQDQMIEVGNRIAAVIQKIIAAKTYTNRESFKYLAAEDGSVDELRVRDLKVAAHPFSNAVDFVIQAQASDPNSTLYRKVPEVISSARMWPKPLYTNSLAYYFSFDDLSVTNYSVWTNIVDTAKNFAREAEMTNALFASDADVGGYCNFRIGVKNSFYRNAYDTRFSTNSWTIMSMYRRQYDNSVNGPMYGYLFKHFASGAGGAISLYTRNYYNNGVSTALIPAADVAGANSNAVGVSATSQLQSNVWTHIALRYDNSASSISIFINGVKEGTTVNTNLSRVGNLATLYSVGGKYNATDGSCGGDIGQFEVLFRALSDSEILSRASGQLFRVLE